MHEDYDELHAWCLLEESENELWQEVIAERRADRERCSPRVKLDRTSTTKKFVAANGEKIKDLGEKTIPFKSVEGLHRSIQLGM